MSACRDPRGRRAPPSPPSGRTPKPTPQQPHNASRTLLRSGVEDYLEDYLGHRRQRVRIAVSNVDLAAAEAQMIGDRDVRAIPLAVSASVGDRRIADDPAQPDRERRVGAELVGVAQTLKPLNVIRRR